MKETRALLSDAYHGTVNVDWDDETFSITVLGEELILNKKEAMLLILFLAEFINRPEAA